MHADEAIHADKLGTLLEGGGYAYDPAEYHGPTLYYLTAVSARLQGVRRYVDVDEAALRSVPAAVGTLLVAAHVLARPALGTVGAAFAALFCALSPAMVFYGRYYIHEVLLVAWSFGALASVCLYLRRPSAGAALAAGASAGLMLATKETAPIALAALAAGVLAAARAPQPPDATGPPGPRARARDVVLALAAAACVAALFLSSFLDRPRGVLDALLAYGHYVERATGDSPHVHPWHYYIGLLAYVPADGTPLWTEALILLLAVVGGAAAWRGAGVAGADPRLLRLIAVSTAVMLAVYSAIPYKTPWCLLGFLHGLILLAGAGAALLVRRARSPAARTLAVALLALGCVQLGRQSVAGSFRFAADPRNPYVYAHTTPGVFQVVDRLNGLATVHPAGTAMPLQVVTRANAWPLPFYLRRLAAVEFWNGVSDAAPAAPVVVLTPEMEPALVHRLYDVPPPGARELYVSVLEPGTELRPGVELRAYASASLWQAYLEREAASRPSAPPAALE
jgi:uncharacterized protein (TIGR03663 family)